MPPVGIEPIVLPGVEPVPVALELVPGAVDALPMLVEEPVEPAPAAPGAVPPAGAVCAVAAVARMAAVAAMIVFTVVSWCSSPQRGGEFVVGVVLDTPLDTGRPVCPSTTGLVDPPASVPTRPSVAVPRDEGPIGGVTAVEGCGSAGTTGAVGDVARPEPVDAIPGDRKTPAGV